MYDIASAVAQWQAAGQQVMVARVVEVHGLSSRNPAEAVATAAGSPLVGSVLSGAVDGQLTELLTEQGPSRIVELRVDDPAARRVGLSCGGRVRLIVGPAAELPPQLWARLMAREPACLVTAVRGDAVGATRLLTEETVAASGAQVARLFAARVSRTAVAGDAVVTALWPVPTLVIVGAGSIADALVANATLLDWLPVVVDGGLESAAAISQLSRADAVVVLSHARHVDGPALLAALEAEPGYIGALGSRQTQEARSRWLTDRAGDRGISPDLAVIHGPAGLDVGANTPAEIAVAILAEILAVRSGATATPLGEREGPIHRATLS